MGVRDDLVGCAMLLLVVGGCRRLSVVKELMALHWLSAAKFLLLEWCWRNISCCCFLVVSLRSPALYYVPCSTWVPWSHIK
jgi:hypothetical protein